MQIAAHQWLAAGETELVDPQPRDDLHKAGDFLEREQFVPRHESHIFGRHAVEAADVAAIGDADPQAVVHTAKGIEEHGEVAGFGCQVSRHSAFRSRVCWMDPIGGAVGPVFALPDGNFLLDGVDQPAAGGEGVVAVRRTDGHGHADFAQFQMAQAMDHATFYQRPLRRAWVSSSASFCSAISG